MRAAARGPPLQGDGGENAQHGQGDEDIKLGRAKAKLDMAGIENHIGGADHRQQPEPARSDQLPGIAQQQADHGEAEDDDAEMVDGHQQRIDIGMQSQFPVGVKGRGRRGAGEADGADQEHDRADMARTQSPDPAGDEERRDPRQQLQPEAVGQRGGFAIIGIENRGIFFLGEDVLQVEFHGIGRHDIGQRRLSGEEGVILGIARQAVGLG